MKKPRLSPRAKAFVDGIIARQREAFEESNKKMRPFAQKELDTPPTTYEYRLKKMVDWDTILKLASDEGYSLEWLLLGKGSKKPSR